MPKRLISMYLSIWSSSCIYRGCGAVPLASQFVHEAVGGDVAPNKRMFRVPYTSVASWGSTTCIVSLRFRVLPRRMHSMTCIVSLRFRVLPRRLQMRIPTSIWIANSGQLQQTWAQVVSMGQGRLCSFLYLGLVGWTRVGPLPGLGPTPEKINICPNKN